MPISLYDISIGSSLQTLDARAGVLDLHVHAATATDILRQAGAPIGKRDFLGQLRVKETR